MVAIDASLYSSVAVLDNNFYIVDGSATNTGLSVGATFSVGNTSGIVSLILPATAGTVALLSDISSMGVSYLSASNLVPGVASVYLTTTTGGTSINSNLGVSLKLNYNDITQMALSDAALALLPGASYNISHLTNGAAQDLTISQGGNTDSSLILSSEGTGADAILIKTNSGTGGIDINSTGTGGVTIDSGGLISFQGAAASDFTTSVGAITLDGAAGVVMSYGGTAQATLTSAQMALLSNEAYTITHVANGAADDLTISQTGAFDASLILSSAGTGADAFRINATAGGIDINAGSGGINIDTTGAAVMTADAASSITTSAGAITLDGAAGVVMSYGGTAQATLTSAEMTLLANTAYTITHAANSVADDLTISQTGAFDASLILKSAGTGQDAIQLSSSGGGIDIVTAGTSSVQLQNNTKYYTLSKTTTSDVSTEIWTRNDGVTVGGAEVAYNVNASFSVLNATTNLAAFYVTNTVYYFDGTNSNVVSNEIVSRGNTQNNAAGLGNSANMNITNVGKDPSISFKPTSTDSIVFKGLVTVTSAG